METFLIVPKQCARLKKDSISQVHVIKLRNRNQYKSSRQPGTLRKGKLLVLYEVFQSCAFYCMCQTLGLILMT